jgi:glutamate dehydrogenase
MRWEQNLRRLLDRAIRRLGLDPLAFPYEEGFPEEYKILVSPRRAVRDVLHLDLIARSGRAVLDLRRAAAADPSASPRLVLYSPRPYELDEILPLLRNLGLRVIDQVQYKFAVDRRQLYIRNFSVGLSFDCAAGLSAFRSALTDAVDALLARETDDDALNGLILRNGLDWRQVDLLRAYCNYYFQICTRFEPRRIWSALLTNFKTASLLYKYFEARFDPDPRLGDANQRESGVLTQLRLELANSLEKVVDVNEDRILRDLFNIIDATLRTNFYLPMRRCISLKIGSLGVINMPSPRPLVEIYVHSPTMEGVHLRGAKVARGGVRWSDRPDDFRNEILGLMRTQMVKNALIAPQGAKGGFVLKTASAGASERAKIAQEAYSAFIHGLLDLTDNVRGLNVARPPQLICYDDPDPYLVVAADKGTANWSDLANQIAAEYGFWLDDAFATGGSRGFHHKSLGITARGAWICVKRHFFEVGHDIDRQAFTVVGVGGMEGDVFGNGMLQSSNIRLLAAFNADYIFLDPQPDSLASFAERKRLFETPGSTWRDYNPSLISPGGGVFPRNAKDIPLSVGMRELLNARSPLLDGDALIRLLLSAPVDLLWMGGVGAYVKASAEANEMVADRANDGARVNASDIRAKVVGEGANLGFTQRARVEYALRGGHINTDAIDNSAGVDLSDHEVNIKILLSPRTEGGATGDDRDERDCLLHEVADEVCLSVLNDNYHQSLSLSLERVRCRDNIAPFFDLADLLENASLLDRSVEVFPLRKEVSARDRGLTRPELAVLTAHAKLALKRLLLESGEVLEEYWTRAFLAEYFPARLRARYSGRLKDHLLRQEIAATVICNKIVDQAGACFLTSVHELDAKRAAEAVGLYLAFDRILQGDRWRAAVCSLDGNIATERQYETLLQLEDALAFFCRWARAHGWPLKPDLQTIDAWRADLRRYLVHLGQDPDFSLAASAVADTSRPLLLKRLRDFPILVVLSRTTGRGLGEVAEVFDDFNRLLGLTHIATLVSEIKPRDIWERRLQTNLDDRLRSAAARFTLAELRTKIRQSADFFHAFDLDARLAEFHRLRNEIVEASSATLTPFAALAGELDELVEACLGARNQADQRANDEVDRKRRRSQR